MGVYIFIFSLLITTKISFAEDVAPQVQNKNNNQNGDWNLMRSQGLLKNNEGFENYGENIEDSGVRKDNNNYKSGEFGFDNGFQNGNKIVDNDFNILDMNMNDTIIRPCPGYDVYCIRKYFARYSKCHPVEGSVPEPYYRAQGNYLYSNFNLSATQTGIYYRGFQGVIEDFYLNNQTDLAVLTVRFRNYRLNSTLDFYRFYRVGKEPAITQSVSAAFFPSLTTTTIFRDIDNLDLARSETSAYVDQLPLAYVDPSAGVHQDPVVAPTFAAFLANINTALLEALLTDASFAAATFIQYSICDFGLHLI